MRKFLSAVEILDRCSKEEEIKCAFCGGELVEKEVTEEIRLDNDHILVPVTAEVCGECSERYFPEGTIDRLIRLKESLKKKKVKRKEVSRVLELERESL